MKTRTFALTVITCFLGIATFLLISGANKGIGIVGACTEVAIYKSHHKPTPGWYYSVEETSTESGKTFVIGTNVRPQVGGTVTKNGKMIEIEVPSKKAGALKGAYCIVRNVSGVPTTVYFLDEKTLVLDALQN
jgi:hypothetical protein